MLTSAAIKAKARELGFDACGIASAESYPELEFFAEWLTRGYAGSMAFLAKSADLRADARHAMPSTRTVIATATVYNTARPYSTASRDPDRAHVARYAWGEDYHEVILARLDRLVAWMHEVHPEPFEACPYVDTGPVQERVYAQRAGIGWIGKNSCVIHPRLGSWTFLSEILCSLPLETDAPALDQCGSCTLCLEACPTQAIVGPAVVDARRCISYLTIEHRGQIPEELSRALGTQVYGCDICQEVCPWNAAAPQSADPAWQPRPVWDAPRVSALADLSDESLRDALDGSPMKRARAAGLRRNIAIAARNSSP